MNKEEGDTFLFNIAKEIKRSFNSPVIFITSKDYVENIFNALVGIRKALLGNAKVDQIVTIIYNFHLQWLQSVHEIEQFKKRVKNIPREVILDAIDYTIDCVQQRYKHLEKFVNLLLSTADEEKKANMKMDLKMMTEMLITLKSVLLEKKKNFYYQADHTEYAIKVKYEIQELLNWLDRLNDCLAIQFSKVMHLHIPQFASDLTKTLKQIISEVANHPHPDAPEIAKALKMKGLFLNTTVRVSSCHDLEISKVIAKIKGLENRAARLKKGDSVALQAIQHKIIFLEEQLQYLEDLRTSIGVLKSAQNAQENNMTGDIDGNTDIRIFNHNLPERDRYRLVEQLMKIWDSALSTESIKSESALSILSVADLHTVFSDNIGSYIIDDFGRSIYTKSEDGKSYQLDENNELVEVNDESNIVYFYDKIGRFYVNKLNERVYKKKESINPELQYTEKVLNLHDIQNRFVGKDHHNVISKYVEKCQFCSKYDKNVIDNHMKVVEKETLYKTGKTENILMEECIYLQKTVGEALKKVITNIVLTQPSDPIESLAHNLIRYHLNTVRQQAAKIDQLDRDTERNRLLRAKSFTVIEPPILTYYTCSQKDGSQSSVQEELSFNISDQE